MIERARIYREELAQPRAMATLGFVFGALALVVAAGGLFGVLSHTVGTRRREFGIRLVLGSTPGEIRRLVFRDGLLTAGIGIALGAAGAWTATSALAALLWRHGHRRLDLVAGPRHARRRDDGRRMAAGRARHAHRSRHAAAGRVRDEIGFLVQKYGKRGLFGIAPA